jgi:phytoene dehydrogenase-like protein
MRDGALVVGAGPNGLAAAITLARAGWQVMVREAAPMVGGGARSAELTLPGYVHDVCSAIHPLAVASPFFRALPLAEHGLEWIEPPAALAHPFDDGTAALLERSLAATAVTLGADAAAYRRLMAPLVDAADALFTVLLGPLRPPRPSLALARFGLAAIRSATGLATAAFAGPRARALFAGLAAHSAMPLESPASAAIGLVLGLAAHAVGWPMPRGGAGRLSDALASHLRSLGATIVTGARVERVDRVAEGAAVLLDLVPRDVARVCATVLPPRYRRRLERWRHGPGAFKLDWALREPIPWRAPECRRAGTVHLGGTLEEIAASERAPREGRATERPFVLLVQPTLFDPSRAPGGGHVAWAYCHVPNGSTMDMIGAVEAQIERFAPGFRDVIVARSVRNPADLERHDANLVGGDVNGGALDLRQLLFRPVPRLSPHRTPVRGLYVCSAATWPCPGVHGMCGHLAGRAALDDLPPPRH